MLSRIFPSEHATSVWVELVEHRVKELKQQYGQQYGHPLSAAAMQDISRARLRNWDASARSWVQTADEVRVLQGKQLMLFAKNIDLQVDDKTNVYESVISAWKNAMTAMENLLKGMPQMVQGGAVLLGLSAWHIYPDMVVLKNESTVETKFDDDLVPKGGLMTIPTKHTSTEDGQGVRWSLSLAHLRFYGEPVKISRSSGAELSRITFDQLALVLLGAIAKGWGFDEVEDVTRVAQFFTKLWNYLERYLKYRIGRALIEYDRRTQEKYDQENTAWLKYITETSINRPQKQFRRGDNTRDNTRDTVRVNAPIAKTDIEVANEKTALVDDFLKNSLVHQFLEHPSAWFSRLARAAQKYLDSKAESDMGTLAIALAKLGQRGGGDFLGPKHAHSAPVFGMLRPLVRIRMFSSEEARIQVLRRIATECGLDALPEGSVVIRYLHRRSDEPHLSNYEYTTAFPVTLYQKSKGIKPIDQAKGKGHARWIGFPACSCAGDTCEHCACGDFDVACTSRCHPTITSQRKCLRYSNELNLWQLKDDKRASKIAELQEECFSLSDTIIDFLDVPEEGHGNRDPSVKWGENHEQSWMRLKRTLLKLHKARAFTWRNAPKQFSLEHDGSYLQRRKDTDFMLVCGDPQTAAVYVRMSFLAFATEQVASIGSWRFDLDEITTAFEGNSFKNYQPNDLVAFLTNLGPTVHSGGSQRGDLTTTTSRLTFFPSLMAFASAATLFDQLANATISLGVISQPLYKALWVPNISSHYRATSGPKFPGYQNYVLSREQIFACIAMFDNGDVNIDPNRLRKVMALSSGNSIYVVKQLLCDPSTTHAECEIKRVVGNIGRAGIGMLYPPDEPRISKPDNEGWQLVNHNRYNGEKEDNFGATSMHLMFTGYEESIGSHGLHDAQVTLLESVVAVRDGGEWRADLDVLRALESEKLKRYRKRASCDHHNTVRCQDGAGVIKLTSIDNWHELLELDGKAGVVRANGNWIARLATTVMALQKGHEVVVIENEPCWHCMRAASLFGKEAKKGRQQPARLSLLFIH